MEEIVRAAFFFGADDNMFGDFWCDVYSLWRFLFLRRKVKVRYGSNAQRNNWNEVYLKLRCHNLPVISPSDQRRRASM
jgi:hypothetical protein